MFDIFLMDDARKLMKNKSIVFLGDSNVRALYKDFLCLLNNSQFISDKTLRTKMEKTVLGDKLVNHGLKTNARCYKEEREAFIESTHVSFFFLTRVYDDYVKKVLKKITEKSNPDVIVLNSFLWDLTRWGCDGVKHFKEDLQSLMKEFKRILPDCLIIWITVPPIARDLKGGFLVNEIEFLKYSLRFHVVEANHYARKVVIDNGFDVLDIHFHLLMQIHRRCKDGVHWLSEAVRYKTNLLLRHISLAWNIPLPHRYECVSMEENLSDCRDSINAVTVKAEREENVPNMMQICPGKTTDSPESNNNTVSKPNKRKEKNSVPLPKASRKREGIHNYMAKKEKKARQKRNRQRKQHLIDNSPVASSSFAQSVFNNPMFNPNFQPYNATYHPYQNFPSTYNGMLPSYDFYHYGSGLGSNGVWNFSGQSRFQNYGVPYVFPSVTPGQTLQPKLDFTIDYIPPYF